MKESSELSPRPSYLNKKELSLLCSYLNKQIDSLTDALDEDELLIRINKTERLARERVESRRNPSIYPLFDSEDEEYKSDDDRLYQEEVDFIMRHDFFRQMVDETNASKFDKKTMNWLRKKMELLGRKEHLDTIGRKFVPPREQTDESFDESELYKQPTKRLTRGMAKNSRIRRREERESRENLGITALLESVEEMEANKMLSRERYELEGHIHNIRSDGSLSPSSLNEKNKQSGTKINIFKTAKKSNKRRRANEGIQGEGKIPKSGLKLSGFVQISKWRMKLTRFQRALIKRWRFKFHPSLWQKITSNPSCEEYSR